MMQVHPFVCIKMKECPKNKCKKEVLLGHMFRFFIKESDIMIVRVTYNG